VTTLITGAAGFIGFHTAAAFISRGERVILIDNFNSYYPASLKKLRASIIDQDFGLKILRKDVANLDEVEEIFSKNSFNTVIHLAAQAGIRIPLSSSSAYVDANLVGFSNIATTAAVHKVPNVIYASSSSVYGDTTPSPYKESHHPLHPLSFYGATKLSNEILAETISRNSETNLTGLRFFTAYGPYGRPDMAYFRIATSLIHNKKFFLFGDGTVRRDFTFIEDIVTAICKIRDFRNLGNGERHEIYNVGGGSPHSILEMIDKFESLTHLKLNLEVAPPVLADVQMTLADTTKLQADTGFIPQITLDDGISKFLSWSQSPGIDSRLLEWVSS